MKNIDYDQLKKDLLSKVGPWGIMPAVIEIDSASKDKLIRLADRYGLDIEDYVMDWK